MIAELKKVKIKKITDSTGFVAVQVKKPQIHITLHKKKTKSINFIYCF